MVPFTREVSVMETICLSLEGVKLLRPKIFCDDRGFFRETYRRPLYQQSGIDCEFVQDNHSYSRKGTIRGMHFQRRPGQAKLVTVTAGRIYDVVVDIRKERATFGQWEGVYLDGEKGEQLFVPIGFAHGFCVVSDEAHVIYKVSNIYDPAEEVGFRFDDPHVNISWPVDHPLLSDRDLKSSYLHEVI
jgi:dTDP-4-dehydrorhamnose 3,5-epimerase